MAKITYEDILNLGYTAITHEKDDYNDLFGNRNWCGSCDVERIRTKNSTQERDDSYICIDISCDSETHFIIKDDNNIGLQPIIDLIKVKEVHD